MGGVLYKRHSPNGRVQGAGSQSDVSPDLPSPDLGFTLNERKVILELTKIFKFLGLMVDIVSMELCLPENKMKIHAE